MRDTNGRSNDVAIRSVEDIVNRRFESGYCAADVVRIRAIHATNLVVCKAHGLGVWTGAILCGNIVVLEGLRDTALCRDPLGMSDPRVGWAEPHGGFLLEERMKTLRELEIAPSFDLIDRLDDSIDPYETALDLSQKDAVREEFAWRLGDTSWYDWCEQMIERYGGKIVFDE